MTDYDRGFADGAKEKDILIRRTRTQAFEEVLEIINKISHKASARGEFWTAEKTIKVLRRDVLVLKGGE